MIRLRLHKEIDENTKHMMLHNPHVFSLHTIFFYHLIKVMKKKRFKSKTIGQNFKSKSQNISPEGTYYDINPIISLSFFQIIQATYNDVVAIFIIKINIVQVYTKINLRCSPSPKGCKTAGKTYTKV